MNRLPLSDSVFRPIAITFLLFPIIGTLGCGGGSEKQLEAPIDILDLTRTSHRRHDPTTFSEVELGTFDIARLDEHKNPMLVRFQIFAVTADDKKAEVEDAMEELGNTLRDRIIIAVKSV